MVRTRTYNQLKLLNNKEKMQIKKNIIYNFSKNFYAFTSVIFK